MSMNYTQFALRLATHIPTRADELDYSIVIPQLIDYAENRIYRELDLINTVVRDTSGNLLGGLRDFTLPSALGRFVTVQGINVITPDTETQADAGTRNPLQPVSRDFLDSVWNSSSGSTIPAYFAMISDQAIIVGPWPDRDYQLEIIGTIRPTALSQTNPTTFLTLYLPDLFFAAAMIDFSRVLADYGSPPSGAVEHWTANYEALMTSAQREELRRKFAASDWTSVSTPIGKPQ